MQLCYWVVSFTAWTGSVASHNLQPIRVGYFVLDQHCLIDAKSIHVLNTFSLSSYGLFVQQIFLLLHWSLNHPHWMPGCSELKWAGQQTPSQCTLWFPVWSVWCYRGLIMLHRVAYTISGLHDKCVVGKWVFSFNESTVWWKLFSAKNMPVHCTCPWLALWYVCRSCSLCSLTMIEFASWHCKLTKHNLHKVVEQVIYVICYGG